MAFINFVGPGDHADQATRVQLRDRQFSRLRLKAPADASYSPGPWLPITGGGDPTTFPTEDWSCGMWIDDNVTNPDVATGSTGKDNTYSVAWIESTPSTTSPDELYYEIGLTSFEYAVLATGVPADPDLPNRRGPEVQTSAAGITWHIHGLVSFEALSETDSTADQLDDVVLRFALVPDSLVQNSGLSWAPQQYEFKTWPTAAVLAGLTVLHTQTLSRAGLSWHTSQGTRFAQATLELDLLIPAASIADGRAHVVYWLEQSDGRRYFDTTYAGMYSSDTPNSWASVADGPLGFDMYSVDGNATVFGYYGAGEATSGYWQKANGDEIYLASSGSASGSRYGYPTGLRNGYLAGDRNIVFTFSQVTTNDFGAAVMVNPFGRAIIVTPTQIIDQAGETRTVLDSHDTSFVSGDVCEVRIRGLTMEVWRAGVMVSTATVPSEVTSYWYYTFYWALTANTGNRIANWHTVAPPTNRGLTGVIVELATDNVNPSVAEGLVATAYRYSYADGYPKTFIEDWLINDGTYRPHKHATMWIKLEPNAPTASTWMGTLSPEITDSPGMAYADIPFHNAPSAFIAFRREDGELLTKDVVDDVIYDGAYIALPWQFLDESKGLFKFDGFDYPDLPYPHALYPDSVVPVPGAYDFYLRLDLGDPDAAHVWWDEPWRDYLFYPINRYNPGTPPIWHWQDGDDHNGYQGIGYAHVTTPLTTSVPTVRAGVALLVQDTTEGYDYGWKDEIIGYTEQDGPFYYGPLSPGAYHGSWDWEDWITEIYGQAIVSDQGGAILAALNYGQGRTGYHPTQYWFDSDNFMIDGSPHYSFMFSNYLHGSSATNNSVSWYSSGVDGLRLNASPSTTVDSLYVLYAYYAPDVEEPDLLYSMNVSSAWAGMFIRGDVNNTGRWAVNNTQLLKIDGATRTVMGSWAEQPAHTTLHLRAVGDTITVLAGDVVLAEVTDTFNRHERGLGLWCRKGSGDAARWNIVSLWSAGPLIGSLINGHSQDGLVSLGRSWTTVQDRGRTVEPAVVWPTRNYVTLDNGAPQPRIVVWWSLWSPAYPDSLFVLLQLRDWPGIFVSFATGEGLYGYRQFEVDKNTGAIIREMTPFLDSAGPLDFYQQYDAGNPDTHVSADGTQLRAVFRYHTTVEQVYDLATETIASRPMPSPLTGRRYLGTLADGRELWGQDFYSDSYFVLWDPATATRQDVNLGSYSGRGYNGGVNGWDGERYLWGGFLNYHTEPSAYILTAEDIARIPAGVVHSYVVGDTVRVGGGIAQAFTEFVRYDLLAVGGASAVPIEYMFNLDHEVAQGYAYAAAPELATVPANLIGSDDTFDLEGSVGDWHGDYPAYGLVTSAVISRSTDFASRGSHSMKVSASSGNTSPDYWEIISANPIPFIVYPATPRADALYEYSTLTMFWKIRFPNGMPASSLRPNAHYYAYDASDNKLAGGGFGQTLLGIDADGWAHFRSTNQMFYRGGIIPAGTDHLRVGLIATGYSPTGPAYIDEIGVYTDWFSSLGELFRTPSLGEGSTIRNWIDMGDGAIEYRFPNFSFPATFAPPGGNAKIGTAATGAKFVPNA